MKRIWLLCLCLASLTLVGCFHVPDKDWLPSRNKVETWTIEKNDEVEEALNSFMDWIDKISSQRSEMKNSEIEGSQDEDSGKELEYEVIGDETENQWEESPVYE